MKVVTKCERVQPFVVGTDEKGELIWEGQQMPRWQMEMIRVVVDWFGEFFGSWCEVYKYEFIGEEFDEKRSSLVNWIVASKERIEELKRMYPSKTRRKAIGD